jgi:NAD kinase
MRKSWKFLSDVHIESFENNILTISATVWGERIWVEKSLILYDTLNEFNIKYELIQKMCARKVYFSLKFLL